MIAPTDTNTGQAPVTEADMQQATANGQSNGRSRVRVVKPDPEPSVIEIEAGELHVMVPAAVDALAVADANLYQRSGEYVTIAIEPERVEPYERSTRRGSDITLRPGTPRIHNVSAPELGERLAAAAKWMKWVPPTKKKDGSERPGSWAPADPPSRVVAMVHARTDRRDTKPLEGIVEAPMMRPDGSIIEEPGYDSATAIFYKPSCKFPRVPSRPTRAQAQAALGRLWIEMLSDFPFKGMGESDAQGDEDRAKRYEKARTCPDAFVAISALLTLLGRHAIAGPVPGHVFEAAAPGTGKTLQMNAVATVATGRAASVATFPSSRGEPNEEELEKVLASCAIAGCTIVAFDNVRGQLGGAALEKALTAEQKIALRVLGESIQRELPWYALMMFSGNNMTMSDDTLQRVLVSRLESERVDPRKRPPSDYRHADLLAALRERRPALICDALTVLRAFVIAPAADKAAARREAGSVGSYYAWSELVPAAIAYAGGARVIDARPDVGEMGQDSESEAHTTLLTRWFWESPVKVGDMIRKLFDHERDERAGLAAPDEGYDDLRAALRTLTRSNDGATPNANSLGMKLRQLRGKWRMSSDGGMYKIECEQDKQTKVMVWRRVGKSPPPKPPAEPKKSDPPPSAAVNAVADMVTAAICEKLNAAGSVAACEVLRDEAKSQLVGHPARLERIATHYRTRVRTLRGEG